MEYCSITCLLVWLELDEPTGVLSVPDSYTSAFQFETNSTYNGTIIVRDTGSPPRMESCSFQVFLHNSVSLPIYWPFVIVTVFVLVLISIALIFTTFLIVYFCRYKFRSHAIFSVDSTKSTTNCEVTGDKNAGV